MIYKRIINIAVFILIAITSAPVCGDSSLIACYLTPAPPEVLNSLALEKIEPPVVGGIKLSYCGYTDYTNSDGYSRFIKHHATDDIRLIICNETNYELLKNTVSKISVKAAPSHSLAVYQITKQKDENGSYLKVESQGTTLPKGGITSNDLILHLDPSYIYIKDQGIYFSGEESGHLIIPQNCIYLLKTPPVPLINASENLAQSIDTTVETKSVANKNTEPDSMGNPQPEVQCSIAQVN